MPFAFVSWEFCHTPPPPSHTLATNGIACNSWD